MAFQQGLSGLNAASKALDVISNNVANSGSVGFKTATAQFADLFAAALNGAGFSRMDQNGTIAYSRNGQFEADKDGFIVNAQGFRLTGYPADATGAILPATPSDIKIDTADLPPHTSSDVKIGLNLDSRATAP